jgi:hypothetical protein
MKENHNRPIEEKLRDLSERIKVPSLVDSVLGQLESVDIEETPSTSAWRCAMQKPWGKIAVAAFIILMALVFALLMPGEVTPTAYAVQEILDAMDTIQTLHFKAEFYKQGPFECWMRFDDPAKKPTHMSLLRAGEPLRTIDIPKGSFVYNERTNRVFPKIRDERQKNWYLDFGGFFRKTLLEAVKNDSIVISRATDDETGGEVIVFDVDEGDRECTYVIDATTKLPLRFSTHVTHKPQVFMKRTLAVKNISFIEYNPSIPDGFFEVPADAETVTNEHDITFHPGVGLQVDGLAHEEACIKLIHETLAALNAYDFVTVEKLLFPFMVPPPDKIQEIRTAVGDKQGVTIIEMGEPYETEGYWYVPLKSQEFNGKLKDEQVPVRFYEFEGHSYCRITWPD